MRLADVDFTDLDNFAGGFPHALFALHRREAPVWWHAPTRHTPDNEGFWSVATYDEVFQVLKDPDTYSSERGGDRPYGGTLLQDMPVAGVVLNMMDGLRHARIRRLVSTGLTPRTITRLEDELRRRARLLLQRIDTAPIDFLTDVAIELPLQAICILLGVPEADRHALCRAAEHAFDFRDGNAFDTTPEAAAAHARMYEYGSALIAAKRAHPTDDMLSAVVHARLPDLDPPSLSDAELYGFFVLLFSAGSDTTRNAIAAGLLPLIEAPAEWAALRGEPERLPTAIEEMLRWSTPSSAKRRTATRAVSLGGQAIKPGDKVLVWEGSANRDERTFVDAMRFDPRRAPNPHLAFGHGVHYCLGANLARLEMRVLLEEMLPAFSSLELAGAVEWTRSNRHTGVRHLPLRLVRSASRL
ncbi:MAG: cytochrome P450 [Deltaproteobacteria bacterium]|nr:cytochrome P450 [Deltaproteobacteria bacterium]